LRRKRLNDYFRQKGIQYLVVHAYWSDWPKYKEFISATYTYLDITYRSQLYNTVSEPIKVYREDEVYRSPIYYDGVHRTVFAIWRLRL
jgi:chitinase